MEETLVRGGTARILDKRKSLGIVRVCQEIAQTFRRTTKPF